MRDTSIPAKCAQQAPTPLCKMTLVSLAVRAIYAMEQRTERGQATLALIMEKSALRDTTVQRGQATLHHAQLVHTILNMVHSHSLNVCSAQPTLSMIRQARWVADHAEPSPPQ